MIKRVQAAFEVFAPLRLAGSWDNVGVLLEAPIPDPSAHKIFLTIDLTQKVLNEVLQDEEIGVIISYHPVLFSSFKRITMENEKQRLALICAAKGISIFSPHTALDSCNDGINDWLARGLGKGETRAIKLFSNPPLGQDGCGEGRIHTLAESTNLDEICQRIKKHLNLKYLRRAISDQSAAGKDGIHSIKTIAICAGSGASILNGISADLYLTGEMSHHDVLAATASGSHVLLTEHSNSERGFLEAVLKPKLEQILNSEEGKSKIQVVCSKTDADPLQVI